MSNFASVSGPIFSMLMCLGFAALAVVFMFTLPNVLLIVVCLGISIIAGLQVKTDLAFWKGVLAKLPLVGRLFR